MSSDIFVKPIATAAVAFDFQNFFNENNINKSITFAASCGAGALIGMVVGSNLPVVHEYLPTLLGNEKSFLQRVAEIGLGTSSFFVVNQYIWKNSSYREKIYNKIWAIAIANIAGEYIFEFIAGRPPSILA